MISNSSETILRSSISSIIFASNTWDDELNLRQSSVTYPSYKYKDFFASSLSDKYNWVQPYRNSAIKVLSFHLGKCWLNTESIVNVSIDCFNKLYGLFIDKIKFL